jgi:phospholipid/cholesterol/gamma-HCH transport system substrate-binding protein
LAAPLIERETAIGAVVLVVGVFIMALAYGGTADNKMNGYDLQANFAKAEGINVGAEVRLAGVAVGKVTAQRLDPHFRAQLTLRMAPDVKLPRDSAALIETDGLLGSKFVAVQPGADEADLKPGGSFQFTQSSMNVTDILELIISQAKAARADAAAPTASKAR